MGWGSIARQAAAAEYGRQNWRRFAARRRTAAAAVAVVAVVALGVRWVAAHWQGSWTPWLVLAVPVGVVVLFAAAVAVRVRRW